MSNTIDFDLIYNWGGTLSKTDGGARLVTIRLASNYREAGLEPSQIEDILLSDGYRQDTVSSAIGEVFADRIASEEPTKPQRFAMVAPARYAEVQPLINEAFDRLGPIDFVNRLAMSKDPILFVDKKQLKSWYRLAQRAAEEPYAREIMHNELQPFVEEAMYTSVILAEKNALPVREADKDGEYLLGDGDHCVRVNLAEGTSNGKRFINGNFADFGLACEHIVRAAEYASPEGRLRRALKG